MQRLLDAARISSAADIIRAAMFLEDAYQVRRGNRVNRNASRASQATASRRKAAEQDNPLTW